MPSLISAGDLNRRVTLLRPVFNAHGDEIESWVEAGEAWAAVQSQEAGSGEITESGRTVSRGGVTVVLRYRTDLDCRWRIRDRDLEYEVLARTDIGRLHVRLELDCQEVQ